MTITILHQNDRQSKVFTDETLKHEIKGIVRIDVGRMPHIGDPTCELYFNDVKVLADDGTDGTDYC